jgi:hypothetical protein
MEKSYKRESDGSITVSINFKPEGSFLEQEEQIAKALSEAGMMIAEVSLKEFDTTGEPIIVDNKKMTSRGQEKKSTRRSGGQSK